MPPRPAPVSLKIKNMVCDRCIRVVRDELEKLGLDVRSVGLGEAVVAPARKPVDLGTIRRTLTENGFELLDDRRAQRVEEIKQSLLRYVRSLDGRAGRPARYTEVLAHDLRGDYHSLSALFSSVENMTVEHYVILQKIERAKELLVYGEQTLSEISDTLGYSSVAHLSAQFKQITGFTPTAFKRLKGRRLALDKVGRTPR